MTYAMADIEQDRKYSGCEHYQRKCSLLAPCCNRFYTCRFCHDENENHKLNRNDVEQVKCLKCQKVAEVQSHCVNCNEEFARYFCQICRLYDEVDKGQFHCKECGICRVGGRENFFHCGKCGLCLGVGLQNKHKCIEKVSQGNCPVCMENRIFEEILEEHHPGFSECEMYSIRVECASDAAGPWLEVQQTNIQVGEATNNLNIKTCFEDYIKTGGYTCPLCNQSMLSMRNVWRMLDQEVRNTQMPEEYANYRVQILCRDCHKECKVLFHVIGLKCQHCGSYNTCRTAENEETLDEVVTPQEDGGNAEDAEENEENLVAESDDSSAGRQESSSVGDDNMQLDQDGSSPNQDGGTSETVQGVCDEVTSEDSDSWQTAGESDPDGETK
ncbi:RING finger and CHY zinc finger domain-containing protein 1-like isoform X1 [Ptychodera flava]|uniref:RING finger and CHY zinc finger domain-containing protein 1-like isoform X1 n=1 Tax=Ptychodera flava TaxID=63121 RepID=UPI003969DA84